LSRYGNDVSASREKARSAKARLGRRLEKNPRVNGVGITRSGNGYIVKVNVTDAEVDIPEKFDGVDVRVDVVGAIKKQ
jgi:hypothetical protein